jgi:hypothetical protein
MHGTTIGTRACEGLAAKRGSRLYLPPLVAFPMLQAGRAALELACKIGRVTYDAAKADNIPQVR